MENYLKSIIDFGKPGIFDFQVGYMTGVATAIFIIIAVLLVKICFKLFFSFPSKAQGIKVPAETGSLYVASNAIYELIKFLEVRFCYIEFKRVTLVDRKKHFSIELEVVYNMDGGALPPMSEQLKSSILESLKETFGIENIKEVNIRVKSVHRKPI